jgi:HD-GYP domain-containing protein (c-di-GMP phosphodiesterase class II)
VTVTLRPGFWAGLEQESLWATVLSLEPRSPRQFLPEEQLEQVALAFADFADLKSPFSAGHSRRVGDLAQAIARRLALSDSQVNTIRQAALMHDVGLAAVPSYTLDRPRDRLSQAEQEMLRLHPYHAERIFARGSQRSTRWSWLLVVTRMGSTRKASRRSRTSFASFSITAVSSGHAARAQNHAALTRQI